MSLKFIADSSIWIDCLKSEKTSLAGFMRECITENYVAINGIIKSEILQGCKNKKEFTRVRSALNVLEFLEVTQEIWDFSAEISFDLSRKGKTIPLADCLIAAQCIKENIGLLTKDKHFTIISKDFPLQLRMDAFKQG